MITISVCMIVKNEEGRLRRCLECLKPIADEILIADTGSTDRTKEIAAEFTDHIYDFPWVGDFSAARNFIFSKARMDYIYTADADEELDAANIRRFLDLKKVLLPEIEIVQMRYLNLMEENTAYNARRELRPKLYRRLRTFEWIDPIHETVRLDPIVYDSEIEILHKAEGNHAKRDLAAFRKAIAGGTRLSKKLHSMYAKELLIAGDPDDLAAAEGFFRESYTDERRTPDERREAACVLARCYRLRGEVAAFFRVILRELPYGYTAELCTEIGAYFYEAGDFAEALCWYNDAIYEVEAVVSVFVKGSESLRRLADCYEKTGDPITAERLRREADEWTLPETV
ncbi:MAG: glycosyltransferase family 2 protein [Bacteroides sp.]|nr:glycosyltransferase family 2 protein [Eubacterium sp.]MCM1418017.1 glycosyltransferase family 2 protein [Roseburia sp.]MCM1462160.1 glycosyltransferase family 2 protein [Bacteroides sp.]